MLTSVISHLDAVLPDEEPSTNNQAEELHVQEPQEVNLNYKYCVQCQNYACHFI